MRNSVFGDDDDNEKESHNLELVKCIHRQFSIEIKYNYSKISHINYPFLSPSLLGRQFWYTFILFRFVSFYSNFQNSWQVSKVFIENVLFNFKCAATKAIV